MVRVVLFGLLLIFGSVVAKDEADRLQDMRAAGKEIRLWYERIQRGGSNIVSEVLKGQGTFYKQEHYPKDEVLDHETHSQYYYHAHRPGEHGHFHLFLNSAAIPEEFVPLVQANPDERGHAHLLAISMDDNGYPIGMFVTNQWVTDEDLYPAEELIQLLDKFFVDHTTPSWPVNRWLDAMIRLFYPQIKAMYQQRDAILFEQRQKYPNRDIFKDREFEILAHFDLSVEQQISAIEEEGIYGECSRL